MDDFRPYRARDRAPGERGVSVRDRPWRRHGPERPAGREAPLRREGGEGGEGGEVVLEPDSELVAGRRPVEEAFAARREARRLIVVPERRPALEALVVHATTLRIPVVEVEGGTLTSLVGFDGHQGVALEVAPRQWATPDEIVARAYERGVAPLVLVLDSLEDPQNVGTLMRSAEAAGAHGVIFPTRRAAPLTAAAIKASAGAVEHLLLAPADDLPGTLVDLKARGLRVVGADEEAPLSYRDADLRGPLALVVGSEGRGMSAAVRRRLDLAVRIPMRGRVGSLNAAVAGSVLLFEAGGQRDPDGARPAPPAGEAVPAAPPTMTEQSPSDGAVEEPMPPAGAEVEHLVRSSAVEVDEPVPAEAGEAPPAPSASATIESPSAAASARSDPEDPEADAPAGSEPAGVPQPAVPRTHRRAPARRPGPPPSIEDEDALLPGDPTTPAPP